METIKITSRIAPLFCGAILLMASCVKDDIYNTPHPAQGAVVITTDWSARAEQAVQPISYTLRLSGQSGQSDEQSVKGNTNLFHSLLAPAAYGLLVYNTPEAVTVSGDIARVASTGHGNSIESLPGYLFSATQTLDVVKDDTLFVTVGMRQRIRQLTLVLKLKEGDHDRITGLDATLSGIAPSVNLKTGELPLTAETSLSPIFGKATDSDGLPVLAATIRLLGIATGERQELSVAVTLDNQSVQTIKTDLTDVLRESFDGSMSPLVLGANFDLPSRGDFSGNISDWNPIEGGHVDIH
ncbi:FimB/Mfa2 family fimbrial subunit [Bacteroides congonensis]